jgi:hypothetical protein
MKKGYYKVLSENAASAWERAAAEKKIVAEMSYDDWRDIRGGQEVSIHDGYLSGEIIAYISDPEDAANCLIRRITVLDIPDLIQVATSTRHGFIIDRRACAKISTAQKAILMAYLIENSVRISVPEIVSSSFPVGDNGAFVWGLAYDMETCKYDRTAGPGYLSYSPVKRKRFLTVEGEHAAKSIVSQLDAVVTRRHAPSVYANDINYSLRIRELIDSLSTQCVAEYAEWQAKRESAWALTERQAQHGGNANA